MPIHASIQLDPQRAPEQRAALRDRVRVLREAGAQLWVLMEENQVDTLLAAGMGVITYPRADLVELPAVSFRPASEPPEPPAELRAEEPSGSATGDYLVQFLAPVDKSWLQEIGRLGGEMMQAVPGQAAVFRFTRAQADAVRAVDYVAYVGPYHPAYAVGLTVAGVAEPFTATTLRNVRPTLPPDGPAGNLSLQFFDSIDPRPLRSAVEAAGAEVVGDTAGGFNVRVPAGRLNDVLRLRGLFAVEPPLVPQVANDHGTVIVGATHVRAQGTAGFLVNLDGRGEVAGIMDSGFDVGNLAGAVPALPPPQNVMTQFHADLRTNIRLIRNSGTPTVAGTAPDDATTGGPHGTHVSGTIVGDGSASGGRVRGVAPAASLVAIGPINIAFGPSFDVMVQNGARIINNSWGVPQAGVPPNPYTNARTVDVWCYENPDVLVLHASGNEEEDVVPAPGGDGALDARRMRLEAMAKNALTVGATENLRRDAGWRDSYRAFFGARYNHANFDVPAGTPAGAFGMSDNADHIALFSGRGPVAATNRIKPDIVAPGTNVVSVRSQWVAWPPPLPDPVDDAFYSNNFGSMVPPDVPRNLYEVMNGTSMATPMTTGCAILVRQYYRTRFAQLRRPLLLEGVPIPGTSPLPVFPGLPSVAAHTDGLVFAWCTPALPSAQKNIVAMRLGRGLAPVDSAPVHLQDNVGDHPAPKIVTRGERTYLLHRHGDGTVRLSCYDRALARVNAFGTNGVVTLSPNARPDDNVTPDLLVVGEHLACVFPAATENHYHFQRFRADTGAAVDAASFNALATDNTGPHTSLVHTGGRYTICGVAHGENYVLQVRQVDNDGNLVAAGPTNLVNQAQEIREPCLVWSARLNRHALVWCDARTSAGGEIYLLFVDDGGAAIGAPRLVVSVPNTNRVRRPRILVHPTTGFVLLWEDDTQSFFYDVYVAFLGDDGQIDGRLPQDANDPLLRRLIRISDTPQHTSSFTALSDARGLAVAFQSPDEIRSDRMGVYAVNLTPAGAFEAQEDPETPLIRSGRYVAVETMDHDRPALTLMSAEWAGGSYYLLRGAPAAVGHDRLEWVRLNADARLDGSYGVNGVRAAPAHLSLRSGQLLWTGTGLLTAVFDASSGITVYNSDALGAPIAAFGAGGAAAVQDPQRFDDRAIPQLGWIAASSHIAVAYGTIRGGVFRIRYQRLDAAGVRVGAAPVNLVEGAAGVAPGGWFQFVPSENSSIAIYHRVNGAVTRVHCRRFNPDGTPNGAEQTLSAAAGEAINGVLARRPITDITPTREYGAVWQYRANNAAKWELRFSSLDQTAVPKPDLAGPPVFRRPDFPVITPGGPDWPADRDAIEPQLVCTYTHEPWAAPPPPATPAPAWSPSYGLAWIGVLPGGARVLFFTVLDENGRRILIPQPPPVGAGALNPSVAAPLLQVTATGSNVRNFKLVWNGRIFFLSWTEQEGTRLKHRCTAITRSGSQLTYDMPSAALLRATMVNGATNLRSTNLPNLADGYGWGRVNLWQTMAPAPPVTMQVRDNCAIGPGGTVSYRFTLPAGTALLKVTLNWTDPPGAAVVNALFLAVRAPAVGANPRQVYRGNVWDAAANRTHLSRAIGNPPVAADAHDTVQTFKQVVIANPPPGVYDVEVSAGPFPANNFNQLDLQPFALVFAGSGPEVRFSQLEDPAVSRPVY